MNGIALLPVLLVIGGWLAAQIAYDLRAWGPEDRNRKEQV